MESSHAIAEFEKLCRSDPSQALSRLEEFAQLTDQPADLARIYQAGALAARHNDDLARSTALLNQAMAEADRSGNSELRDETTLTEAYNLFLQGDTSTALASLDRLKQSSSKKVQARALFQKATILARSGRWVQAQRDFHQAAQGALAIDDQLLLAMVDKNLAMLATQQGDFAAAHHHSTAAIAAFDAQQMAFEAATVRFSSAQAAANSGDLAGAFRFLNDGQGTMEELGSVNDALSIRCRVLALAGLFGEAAVEAGRAADVCRSSGLEADWAENKLHETMAWLEVGDLDRAADAVAAARQAFVDQHRSDWLAMADLANADIARHRGDPVDAATLHDVAFRLRRFGRHSEALQARLLQAVALARSAPQQAKDIVDDVVEDPLCQTFELRLLATTTAAECAFAAGHLAEAEAMAARGHQSLVGYQRLLASPDLRVAVRLHGRRLATLGLEVALEAGDPELVLKWTERRLVSLNAPRPVRPSSDPDLRSALARLRSPNAGDGEKRRQLEQIVRDRARAAPGVFADTVGPVDGEDVSNALGSVAGVSMAIHNDTIVASRLVAGETDTVVIPDLARITRTVRSLRSDLRVRALWPDRSKVDRIMAAAALLDQLLLKPLDLPDGSAVIAPAPVLVSVPWNALPSRIAQPTTVATSLSTWATTSEPTTTGDGVVIVGPGLRRGDQEAAAVVAETRWNLLRGSDATVAATLSAMDGASVAHIVAHGLTRPDNPLLSSIELADGPLHVYEVDQLERPPQVVVLAACHLGLSSETTGRELLGMVTGFLNHGSTTVVANTLPLSDSDNTMNLMRSLHGVLSNRSPAAAWADVQRTLTTDEDRADTMGFVVFGRG